MKVGTYYVVVDIFVSDGEELLGAYELDIGFTVFFKGFCEMEIGIMDCVGDGGEFLFMFVIGFMVMEVYLVM